MSDVTAPAPVASPAPPPHPRTDAAAPVQQPQAAPTQPAPMPAPVTPQTAPASGEKRRTPASKLQLGGLVVKARLGDMPTNALYGALLMIAERRGDAEFIAEMTKKGGAAFERERADKVRISIKFANDHKPSNALTKVLRTYGCSWNRIMEVWLASVVEPDVADLRNLVEQQGGVLTVISKVTPKAKPAKVAVRVLMPADKPLDAKTAKRLRSYGVREAAPGVWLGVADLGLVRALLGGLPGVKAEAVQV